MGVKKYNILDVLTQEKMEKLTLGHFYEACLPITRKVASNYVHLDTAVDLEDLLNQAYFAVRDTFLNFRFNSGQLKITSYLVWQLQKHFSELCPLKHWLAVIYYPQGSVEIVTYQKFQKFKRTLSVDTEYLVLSRVSSLDDLKAKRSNFPGESRN